MIMEVFYKNHLDLLASLNTPIKRQLSKEIDLKNRLIGIKGARGIGKTTFLLDYIKTTFENDKSCLYINLNNFYFSQNSLVEFADNFRKKGGKILVLDQIFKYPNWSKDLAEIYDRFYDLKIIFTGSPVMRLKENNEYLYGKVFPYQLRGLSFREYINYQTQSNFTPYSLNDLLKYHSEIAKDILLRVKPLAYFYDYLKRGFYPFFTEKGNFNEYLLKTANLTLEIDLPFLQQVDIKYVPRLKKLFHILSEDMPHTPNISKLSSEIKTSRATVSNYLQYLQNARLIRLLCKHDEDDCKKPNRIYFQNTNLLYAISMNEPKKQALYETFFFNQMNSIARVEGNGKKDEFLVNNKLTFKVGKNKYLQKSNPYLFIATEMEEIGFENKIPIWLFGFLN